ncbi:Glycosyltransferase involved in cell wall bisynthesis [Carboxydocella sporoproducens DSM 16521]|uniref:Glycosyltransferase involved in cell wall bisynthesis n=2 Tax=Carboxydocella TaxID=178898 RepID=A0A1T4PV38_9FIRM|nr:MULTISPECIES: glycosyltransferase family 4 protein [Carboxydocella]AVX20450.1 Glycosyltransferase involved in cell wall bisynthesis [Carboxydocella thermautotrophica]AVX30871.1 Glycosyltransferase involved in cell wall bisynthesis [Carboxydocella thermautotrophica]SJZ95415.1 Glycosyltransferase involved in cell wall bisynthesis [Carboxydocella sporoproducens DSM 16521]
MNRILYVVRPVAGGMAEHIRSLIQGLDTKWEIVLAGPPQLKIEGKTITYLPLKISASLNPWADWPAVYQLRRYLQEKKFDLIHAHGAKAGLISRLAAMGSKTPVLITAHNLILAGSVKGWKGMVYKVLERVLAGRTTAYIAVSRAIARELEQLGARREQIHIIYNGIDTSFFSRFPFTPSQARAALGISQEAKIIGSVARFAPQKGLNYFVEMAELMAREREDLLFLLVGDGPLKPQLEEQVKISGLSKRFVFTGHVEDIRPYLRAIDVFVLPSLSEGMGISLLEAAAAGLPMVATNAGGIPEVITDGREGWLVPVADSRALAAKVGWVLDNLNLAQQIALAAKQKIETQFSLAGMIKATESVYQKIISEGKRN